MPCSPDRIQDNLRTVQRRIADAAHRAGRAASDVALVAVVKEATTEETQALVDLGVCDLGESRPQQLWERVDQVRGAVRWHLIGHLQRNKARRTLPLVEMIHSVDSLRLLRHLDVLGGELSLRPRLLLEVNASGEAAKNGFAPDALPAIWDEILAFKHVRVEGLMTMAAWESDPQQTRPTFALVRQLRDRLRKQSPAEIELEYLSMGMSNDFEIAVEEGATIVRVGTALFQP